MEAKKLLETTIDQILNYIGASPTVSVIEDASDENDDDTPTYIVDIDGRNLNYLIGYRGETLFGLQYYLGLVLFQQLGEWHRVLVDINGYRESRNERLEDIARKAIDKVRFFREEVSMRPMTSYERRAVHMFVSEYDDVFTESEGEGGDRRIIVKLKEEE